MFGWGEHPQAVTAHVEIANLQVAEKDNHNPCATLDAAQTNLSLAHDAYHINPELQRCSQVCMPDMLRMVARMHGVQFGAECQKMGYTELFESGANNGVSYFNFVRPE